MENGIKNYHICTRRGIWTGVVRCFGGFFVVCWEVVFFVVVFIVVWFGLIFWLFAVGVLLLFRWNFFNTYFLTRKTIQVQ